MKQTSPLALSLKETEAQVLTEGREWTRQRREDWGQRAADPTAERVAWHEIKGALIYRLEQAGQTAETASVKLST